MSHSTRRSTARRPGGSAWRRATLAAAFSGCLLLTLQAWPVGAQASSAPSPAAQLRSDAHAVRDGLRRDARQLRRGVKHDSHQVGHEFRHAGDQMRADMHRLGRNLRAWWGHVKARVAGTHNGNGRAHPELRRREA